MFLLAASGSCNQCWNCKAKQNPFSPKLLFVWLFYHSNRNETKTDNMIIFIVKVMRFRFTLESYLWVWDCFQKDLINKQIPTKNLGDTIPWAGILEWIRRKWAGHQWLSFSFSASWLWKPYDHLDHTPVWHTFPVTVEFISPNCDLDKQTQKQKPFKWLLPRILVTEMEKVNRSKFNPQN